MNVLPILSLCLSLSQVFSIQTVPLQDPDPHIHLADCDGDGVAEVVLAYEQTLHWLDAQGEPHEVAYPADARAYDIASMETGSPPALVVVTSEAVWRVALAQPETRPVRLFEAPVALPPSQVPHPRVILVPHNGEILLFLPTDGGWELRRPNGEVVERQEANDQGEAVVRFGRPFTTWLMNPNQIGLPGDMEGFATRVVDVQAQFPGQEVSGRRSPHLYAEGIPDTMRVTPVNWPWFALQRDTEGRIRVHYAMSSKGAPHTTIRIRQLADDTGSRISTGDELGPERTYPGRLVRRDPMPDFNGDGNSDLMFWQSAGTFGAWETIPKALANQTWPIRLTTHLYEAQKQRFAARPSSVIEFDVPMQWIVAMEQGSPLRQFSWADYNGDGRSDLSCAVGDREISVWLRGENGFQRDATQTFSFPEKIQEMVFAQALAPNQPASMAMRGETALYIMRPKD